MLTHCIDIPAKCHASEWYLFRQRHHYQLSDVFHQPAFALVKRTEIRLRPHFHGRCYGRDPPVYREPIGLGLGIRTISAFLAIWAPLLPIRVLDVNAFAFVHRSGCHSFCIANIFLYVPRTFLEVYMSFFFYCRCCQESPDGKGWGDDLPCIRQGVCTVSQVRTCASAEDVISVSYIMPVVPWPVGLDL